MSESNRLTAAAVMAPLAAGALLRGLGLERQVLTGDELHTLNGALARPVVEILRTWTYHGADYCVPLTAMVRAWLDFGLPVSEWVLRAPSLLAGLIAIAVLPPLVAPRVGVRAARWFGWLLAISPPLVLYSRIVRSYMPAALLATLAVLAFDRYWRTRRARSAVAYVLFGALATWFHLGTAVFVAAPLVWAVGEAWLAGGAAGLMQASLRVAAPAVGLAAAAGACLAPAWRSLLELRAIHGRGQLPGLPALLEVGELLVGTSWIVLVAFAAVVAFRGLRVLARRDPAFARLLLTTTLLHAVGLVVLAPNYLEVALVFARYSLVALPLWLAIAAVGLSEPSARIANSKLPRWAQPGLASLGIAALLASGPLARFESWGSSFAHSAAALNWTGPPTRVVQSELPDFYARLADGSLGEGAVLELPWVNVTSHAFEAYQKWHRRELVMASLNRLHRDPRVRLHNIVDPSATSMLASRARWLVVHRQLQLEQSRVATRDADHAARVQLRSVWIPLERAAQNSETRLRDAWGAPDFEDPLIAVWDLSRVRDVLALRQPGP